MDGSKRYEIGGKTYIQRELVLVQEEAVTELLGSGIPDLEHLTPGALADLLLKQKGLRKLLAIVLVPEGVVLEAHDTQAAAEHIAMNIKLSQQAEVIQDFFDINAAAAKRLLNLGSKAQARPSVEKAQ